jgi:hypothetical protein
MQHLPKETVDVLMEKRFLDPGRLVPALMRYIATYDPKQEQENQVIRYLEWCVTQQQNDDPAIHNLLLSLYAKEDDSTRLLAFLNVDVSKKHNILMNRMKTIITIPNMLCVYAVKTANQKLVFACIVPWDFTKTQSN